ncbi:hypothetical protein SLEP1_g6314 [Rubroshorea leprosula]|uniref:K Homology domain-containing protein n=1 Tax=Rubroshorea leprosula TaxID=152421 RepID=A0AAV5I5L5_9ROSI|nr:hypothetical protein SLEP1_g6314 [Rubroshorea leprosula]
MGEGGKRSRPHRDNDGDNKNQKRRLSDKEEKSSDELVVYRILCPDGVIGSVIGKSGKVINSIRQETRAKVKVVDPFPGAKDRVITIYCYVKEKKEVEVDDELDDELGYKVPLCAAQDALLKVHAAIANASTAVGDADKRQKDKEECQLLVPSSQSANIIGKAGATIKKLRSTTRANIKVIPKDANDLTQSCALEFDNFVLINGGPEAVRKALFAISTIMYKCNPREEISLETTVPEVPPSIIIPSDVPIYPPVGLYPNSDPIIPSRSLPPIFSATHVPDLQGYADAGTTWPVYSSAFPVVSGFGSASQSEVLVIRVLCPFDKIGRVIGRGGCSIKSMRQDSGANIEVDDTKANRDECIITVTATESPDDLKSMAVEAVLLLQGKINDEDDDTVTMRLLVPSKIIGCIIGRAGSIINELRKRTKANVRISKGVKPKCADANDELVEVVGEVGCVRDALIRIVLRLRADILKDWDGGHNPSIRERGYGSSYSSKLYGGLPSPSTLDILIPANAVGRIIGKGGANLSNMRKISGAMIEISESKSSRGDRIALVSGTPQQKHEAENLLRAFIMAT